MVHRSHHSRVGQPTVGGVAHILPVSPYDAKTASKVLFFRVLKFLAARADPLAPTCRPVFGRLLRCVILNFGGPLRLLWDSAVFKFALECLSVWFFVHRMLVLHAFLCLLAFANIFNLPAKNKKKFSCIYSHHGVVVLIVAVYTI